MIETLEAKRLVIQASLDEIKTQEERNKLGQFATPSLLARDILSHAKELMPLGAEVKFLDPAFGSGAFYAALRRVFIKESITRASAFEIDRHYGNPAQNLWGEHGLELTHGDFTQAEPSPIFNLIICNPPYVRHHHLSADYKARLHERSSAVTGAKLSGLAGLYVHFLLQTHAWMTPGAIAGWLIPSEFMDVNYGRELKRYLLEKVTLIQIHRFAPDDVQFADALVSSAVVWIKNEVPALDQKIFFTYGGTLSEPLITKTVNREDLVSENKWTRFPQLAVRGLEEIGTRKLGDLFEIKRGLATGDNKFFVLNERQLKDFSIPRNFLRPILPSPRYVKFNEIEADSDGLPTNVSRLYLLDPKMDEAEILLNHPGLAAYLEKGKIAGVHEGYLCRSRRRWYDQEQREPAPIVCTYMGRSDGKEGRPFRFIRNRSNATVANAYLAMYPKSDLKKCVEKDPGLLDTLWHQLNQISLEVLLGEGRVYGGGLHKLEPRELSKVPLLVQ